MLFQFPEYFVHLECSEYGFNKHGSFNDTAANAEVTFSKQEHFIPESCFLVAFQFWQVEIRRASVLHERNCVMKKVKPEVNKAGTRRRIVNDDMAFGEVQSPRPYHQRCHPVI